MAEEKRTNSLPHILTLPYPSQGHINPLLQFAKRLASKGAKTTLAITHFISRSTTVPDSPVQLDTISDGFDDGGIRQAESVESYLSHLQTAGSKSLAEMIQRHRSSGHPIDCIVYDAFLPWALDVAKEFGLHSAAFFTQPCCVNYIYYLTYNGILEVHGEGDSSSDPVNILGMPDMVVSDMPSFVAVAGSYPAYFKLVLNQFCNLEKADVILLNTFHQLEPKVVDMMSGIYPTLTIGPTVPSMYLDKQMPGDENYGLSLFPTSDRSIWKEWLNTRTKGSVVYLSFGSMAVLSEDQMHEVAFALRSLDCYFLWVVRECEEPKIPNNFATETSSKGLLVRWCSQLEVLASEAVGCFFTHCGWNSTLEALSLGVPMVGMPQWTDQPTNAKLIQDVWQVGKRVKVDEKGFVERDEIESCIKEVMDSKDLKKNALKWMYLAKEALSQGGRSDRNVEEFIQDILIKVRVLQNPTDCHMRQQ